MCLGIAKTDPLLVDVIHDGFRLLVGEVFAQYGVDIDITFGWVKMVSQTM